MPQIIPQSDFGSSFGQGLGQGLSEQIPKEVNRYRLSEGLKNLGQQDLKGANPFDLLSKLSSIPGMSPEMMQYALPLLQQQMTRQAAAEHGKSFGMASVSKNNDGVSNKNIPVSDKGAVNQQPQSFKRGGSNYLVPLNPEQINQKIAQYTKDPRFSYKSPDEIRKFVEAEDAQRLANEKAFEDRINFAEKRFNQKLAEKGAESLGKYTSIFRDNVSRRIENGESPEIAAEEESSKALKLNEARTRFDVLSNQMISLRPEKVKQGLKSLRNEYKKAGALEAFRDDLISKEGLSPEAANIFAYPIEENEKLSSEINKLKLNIKPKSPRIGFVSNGDREAQSIQAAKAIEPFITKDDSIFSIVKALGDKGFDDEVVLRTLQNDADQIGINSRQEGEFSSLKNWFPSLADFFLFSMTGEKL